MEFKIIVNMIGCLLLLQKFDSVHPCQPPDYPENGSYEPEKKDYLPGDKVGYSCNDTFTLLGKKESKCQHNGAWSESTPFCDVPIKIKKVSSKNGIDNHQAAKVFDNNLTSCFKSKKETGIRLEMNLAEPAVIHVIRIYLPKGRANFGISFSQSNYKPLSYEEEIEKDKWVTLPCEENSYKTPYLILTDKSAGPVVIQICEIEVYVKNNDWCPTPPTYTPNGRWKVSREIATLQCAEGYVTPDNPRLACENNNWIRRNVLCEKKKKLNKINIALIAGASVGVLLLVLMVSILCLLCKKRNREVVVVYKSGDSYASSNIYATPGSESDYSTVYYDPMVPQPPMSRPPQPVLPFIDDKTSTELKPPIDITFGTLKSSSLYSGSD